MVSKGKFRYLRNLYWLTNHINYYGNPVVQKLGKVRRMVIDYEVDVLEPTPEQRQYLDKTLKSYLFHRE